MSRIPAPHPQTVLGGECSLDRRLWERPGGPDGVPVDGPDRHGGSAPLQMAPVCEMGMNLTSRAPWPTWPLCEWGLKPAGWKGTWGPCGQGEVAAESSHSSAPPAHPPAASSGLWVALGFLSATEGVGAAGRRSWASPALCASSTVARGSLGRYILNWG